MAPVQGYYASIKLVVGFLPTLSRNDEAETSLVLLILPNENIPNVGINRRDGGNKERKVIVEKKESKPHFRGLDSHFWSGLLDSNQRPRAPQTCALPTALNPDPCVLRVQS